MNAAAVPYSVPSLWQVLIDNVYVPSFIERAVVLKREVETDFGPIQPFGMNNRTKRPIYILTVRTYQGDCRIKVPGQIYSHIKTNDGIVVRYKVGRYTSILYGERI